MRHRGSQVPRLFTMNRNRDTRMTGAEMEGDGDQRGDAEGVVAEPFLPCGLTPWRQERRAVKQVLRYESFT